MPFVEITTKINWNKIDGNFQLIFAIAANVDAMI